MSKAEQQNHQTQTGSKHRKKSCDLRHRLKAVSVAWLQVYIICLLPGTLCRC